MAFKKIYASRINVDANAQNGTTEPVFRVHVDEMHYHTNSVIVLGPSELRYDPEAPIGNRVWIETFSRLILKDGKDLTTVK